LLDNGFPESHAASFALIAYASAYLKVKYLAAFTCAILNNQPMGFYMPAVLVKDAQRHGLRVRPIDIQVSDWACTIEHEVDGALSLRMGLGYAKGLRRQSAEAVVATRSHDGHFRSAEDLALRVPVLNRKELTLLARVSEAHLLTWDWSDSLVSRRATVVPHCARIVPSISDGRWLTSMRPTPYFRPSFAIRRAALAARHLA
jgi:DNA polymerase III alpha subunit